MKKIVEKIIFSSKWLLVPFYFGLFAAMLVYLFVYMKEIALLISDTPILTKNTVLVGVLELVDIVMVANLVKMIITGSYNSFVDKTHGVEGETISSSMLKVKMGMSLVGVSSIHLLQSFINSENVSWDDLYKQMTIHVAFLIGALILSIIDYLHCKTEKDHS